MNRYARRLARASAPREIGLQQIVLINWNSKPWTFAYATPTNGTPRRCADGTVRLVRGQWGRGRSDLVLVVDGLAAAVELKMPGKNPEPHQLDWLKDFCERGRGLAFIVRSVEEADFAWNIMWSKATGKGPAYLAHTLGPIDVTKMMKTEAHP